MRVIVEETNKETENKRRTSVECELDSASLDVTLDMIFRGLVAYGYTPADIRDTIQLMFNSKDTPDKPTKDEVPSID